MLVALLPALKMFLSFEKKLKVKKAIVRSCKEGFVKSFEKLARKYLCWSLFLEK